MWKKLLRMASPLASLSLGLSPKWLLWCFKVSPWVRRTAISLNGFLSDPNGSWKIAFLNLKVFPGSRERTLAFLCVGNRPKMNVPHQRVLVNRVASQEVENICPEQKRIWTSLPWYFSNSRQEDVRSLVPIFLYRKSQRDELSLFRRYWPGQGGGEMLKAEH